MQLKKTSLFSISLSSMISLPVTPHGQPTKGYKTRKNKRTTGMIVRRRNDR